MTSLVYAVFVCDRTTGCECEAYSFTTDGYGIFNVRTNVGACCAHEGEEGGGVRGGWGGGAGTNKPVCTRVDSEG